MVDYNPTEFIKLLYVFNLMFILSILKKWLALYAIENHTWVYENVLKGIIVFGHLNLFLAKYEYIDKVMNSDMEICTSFQIHTYAKHAQNLIRNLQ